MPILKISKTLMNMGLDQVKCWKGCRTEFVACDRDKLAVRFECSCAQAGKSVLFATFPEWGFQKSMESRRYDRKNLLFGKEVFVSVRPFPYTLHMTSFR